MLKKIKTLIEVDREIWSLVRSFATRNDQTVSEALEFLLTFALAKNDYHITSKSENSLASR